MKVSLKEYAQMHNINYSTVRAHVARGKLTIVDKDNRFTYVDSSEKPSIRTDISKHGPQPALGNILRQMRSRCYNPNNPTYPRYGGKGIKICDDWKNSLGAFVDWSLTHGYQKGLTIDRIDPRGDYCPENCQWITRSENSRRACLDRYNRKHYTASV